jgi:hypothetical protein
VLCGTLHVGALPLKSCMSPANRPLLLMLYQGLVHTLDCVCSLCPYTHVSTGPQVSPGGAGSYTYNTRAMAGTWLYQAHMVAHLAANGGDGCRRWDEDVRHVAHHLHSQGRTAGRELPPLEHLPVVGAGGDISNELYHQ